MGQRVELRDKRVFHGNLDSHVENRRMEYDVLIVRSATKVKGKLLENAKKLRVIGRAGEGLDNVDFERAKTLRISLVNTPHVSYVSVAELTIGHMLALSRNIIQGTT